MKTRPYLATLLVLAIVITGCGANDGVSATSGAVDQSSDDGTDGDSGSQNSSSDAPSSNTGIPPSASDDFSVAVPDGWEVDILNEIGMTNASGAQLLFPSDDFDRVVAFYDSWIADQPIEYARTEVGDDVIYQRMELPAVLITVTQNHEERGQVFTYLLIAGGNDA